MSWFPWAIAIFLVLYYGGFIWLFFQGEDERITAIRALIQMTAFIVFWLLGQLISYYVSPIIGKFVPFFSKLF